MRYLLTILLVMCILLPFVSAEEYQHVMPLPEEFYGNVTYTDGSIVNAGQITAMDQHGKVIGSYNMTKDGEYGEDSKLGRRLLVHAEYLDDTVYFYVNTIKATNRGKSFDSGEIKRLDIILPLSAKPTPRPTPVPNFTIETTIPTVITTIPTQNGTVISNIPTQPIPTPVPPVIEDNTTKYIGAILIAISFCLISVIIWYFFMSKKMKRDDDEEIVI